MVAGIVSQISLSLEPTGRKLIDGIHQFLTLITVHAAVYSFGFQSLTATSDQMQIHLVDQMARYLIALSSVAAVLGLLFAMWMYFRYNAMDASTFQVGYNDLPYQLLLTIFISRLHRTSKGACSSA
jgi:hypothetical protein